MRGSEIEMTSSIRDLTHVEQLESTMLPSLRIGQKILRAVATPTAAIGIVACQATVSNEAWTPTPIEHPETYERKPVVVDEDVLFEKILKRMLEPVVLAGEDVGYLYQALKTWVQRHPEKEVISKLTLLPPRKRDAVIALADNLGLPLPDELRSLQSSEVFPAITRTLKDLKENPG